MFKTALSLTILAVVLSGCHVRRTVLSSPQPIYQQPVPQPQAGVPPGHGGVPPGHGGVPPGLAKKGGVPPGLAKKGYRPVGWNRGAPPWYGNAHYGAGYGSRQPYGVYSNTCYREDLGTALGAVAGGVAGYQVGGGHGKAAAVIGGTIVGALIGGHIGRSMDDVDQNCVGQILEHAPPNQPITWQDRSGQGGYEVTPSPAYEDRYGRYCREYQSTSTIGGRPQQTYGTACRQPDGSWQIMN
jgi:surface antigen